MISSGSINSTNFDLVSTFINSNALTSSISIITQAAYLLTCLIVYYICLRASIAILRTLWRLKDEIYCIGGRISPSADKVILITGGTSGIGLALAKYFYKRGFSIIVTGLFGSMPDELVEIQESPSKVVLEIDKPKIFFIHLDVTSQDSIANSYTEVKEILAKNDLNLRALINNAGIAYYYPAFWMTREQITALNATNFLGSILMVRQYMPLLIKSPNSRIIHVASCLAFFPLSMSALYNATKAGMTLFMNTLALELESYDVKAVSVHVGDLLRKTSILLNCSDEFGRVREKFSDEEREIYHQEAELHAERLALLDRLIRNPRESVEQNIFDLIIGKMSRLLFGSLNSTCKIEDSYYMKSFDNAVCMKNPSKEIFPGTRFYTYISSSLLESLDSVEKRIVGSITHSLRAAEKIL